MIDPRVLRVGNTLQYANDERLKEDRIGKRFQVSMDDLMYFHKNHVDYVVYAPLSEEILISFGFSKNGLEYSKDGFLLEIEDSTFRYKHLTVKTTLTYIHQLENLFFATMGKELVENKI